MSVQASGSNSGVWGSGSPEALNEGVIEFLDTMLAGNQPFSVASSNVTLSAANVRQCNLRFTGTLLASIVVSPGVGVLFNGFFYFENLTSGNFTITVTTGAGSVVLPQSRRGVLFVDATNGPRIMSVVGVTGGADPIPVGTVMVFYQNAAPAGWTISGALNNYALKIVSSAGGVTSGSVAYSTLFARTATDPHALTTDEIPSHSHGGVGITQNAAYGTTSPGAGRPVTSGTTAVTGGGNGHTHDIDMRVLTASVILAVKN